jgi:5-methylcytosine-specific restriction endonuclease McrA
MTIEHLRRKCEGGTSDLDNIALACQDCNHRRGAIDWLTYASIKRGEIAA